VQLLPLEYFVSDTWKSKSQPFSGQLLNFAQSHLVTLDRLGGYHELKLTGHHLITVALHALSTQRVGDTVP